MKKQRFHIGTQQRKKTFGYTSQEAIGKGIHELVVPTSMCQEEKLRIKLSVKTFVETGYGGVPEYVAGG
jgi:hypothetical protein